MAKNKISILIIVMSICGRLTPFYSKNIPYITPLNTLSSISKRANDSFVPSDPFTLDYGLYTLDGAHTYIDYYQNIAVAFSSFSNSYTIQAPYLVYVDEVDRYNSGKVSNLTTNEVTYEGSYDLWSLTYNTQPYLSSLIVKGYWGNTYVRDISYNLSGNKLDATHYYLQNLVVTPTSSLSGINNLRFVLNDYNFSSDVDYNDTEENRTFYQEAQTNIFDESITEYVNLFRMGAAYFTTTVTIESGYSIIGCTASSTDLVGDFSDCAWTSKGNNSYQLEVNYTHSTSQRYRNNATVIFTVTTRRPAGNVVGPFNIHTPSTPIITTSIELSNIEMNAHVDFFNRYFLDTINCSGAGDYTDRTMVISNWDDVEAFFNALPNENKTRYLLGEDDDLIEMLARYDYCVFHKNYPINDFLNRKNSVNRYYSTCSTPQLIKSNDTSIVIIIASSIVTISSTLVLVYLLKKKRIN